jgi:hypothetical protein
MPNVCSHILVVLKAVSVTGSLLLGLLLLLLLLLLQVADLMAAELRWGGSRRRAEVRNALAYLATFKPPAAATVAAS